MSQRSLTIFCHASDLDGACSQAIARRALGDFAHYVSFEYGDDVPDEYLGGDLLFIDVVPSPYEKFEALFASGSNIWVIDHHDSFLETEWAQKVGLLVQPAPEEKRILSACGLAWRHFFPDKPMPEAVRLLSYYDAWNENGPEWETRVLPFQEYAKSAGRMLDFTREETKALWETWFEAGHEQIDSWIEVGRAILNRRQTLIPEIIRKQAFRTELAGLRLMAVNMAYLNSMHVKDYLADPELDGALGFFYTGTEWKLRLLSKKFHCGQFCSQHFGGGGHEAIGAFTSAGLTLKKGVLELSKE